MKHFLALFAALALVFNSYAQDASQDGPVLKFEEETIDYGTIKRYADGGREFKLTNTGNAPLIINNCAGTCGCTVPSCPKEPIQPGETASIKVKYATDRIGQFNKGIKVYSNASPADQPVMVYIKGNVLAEEDPSHVKEATPVIEPIIKTEPVQETKPHDHPH